MKIELTPEQQSEITVAFLEDDLEWWSGSRNWNKEEIAFRKKYLAALKAILRCLKH